MLLEKAAQWNMPGSRNTSLRIVSKCLLAQKLLLRTLLFDNISLVFSLPGTPGN